MDKNELMAKLLDKLVENMPEPSKTRAKNMMNFFDLLKDHHTELGKVCDSSKSISREAQSIQVLTSISVLIRCMLVYTLDPFNGQLPDLIELVGSMNESKRINIIKDHEKKLKELYEIGKGIIENSKPANDLPYNKKYGGEHRVFNDYLDQFNIKILPYAKDEDDSNILKMVSSVIIYMTDAIRHAVYCTFENKLITNPSHVYIAAMTRIFEEEENRRNMKTN